MRIIYRAACYGLLLVAVAFALRHYGFGIVHSAEMAVLLALVSPGVLVFFFIQGLSEIAAWTLFVCISVIYYEIIYRAVILRILVRHL
jgi:hypothetical protein